MDTLNDGWEGPLGVAWAFIAAAELRRAGEARRVAVFDGDGTIWRGDVGDLHLRYLLDAGILVSAEMGATDPWERYQALSEEDADLGYAFATTAMAGLEESVVRDTAREVWVAHRHHLMKPVTRLMEALMERDWEVWVVSASNRWVVERAVDSIGVPGERVLGVETPIAEGRLTGEVLPPLTNGAGKVAAIRQHIGVKPILGVGNSVHDGPMLNHADVGVLVSAEPGPIPSALEELAAGSGWLVCALGASRA